MGLGRIRNMKDMSDGQLINGVLFDGTTFEFDGVNDYIDFNSSIISTGDKTIELWIKINANKNYNIIVLNCAGLGVPYGGFEIFGGGSGNIQCRIGNNGTGVSQHFLDLFKSTFLQEGVWHNICFVQSNNQGFLYGDGNLLTSDLSSDGTEANPTHNLRIGLRNVGGFALDGNISNIKIYNRALTSEEVLRNYNATKGRFS